MLCLRGNGLQILFPENQAMQTLGKCDIHEQIVCDASAMSRYLTVIEGIVQRPPLNIIAEFTLWG